MIRGDRWEGTLREGAVTLTTNVGAVRIDTRWFVPEDPSYTSPNFLGYVGLLRNLRWGVEPALRPGTENRFWLGPLDPTEEDE